MKSDYLRRLVILGVALAAVALATPVPGTEATPAFGAAGSTQAPGADGSGDLLPDGALARMGTLRWRHSGPVTFVGYAAKGKHVVTASSDGFFRVWDVASGRGFRRFGRDVPEQVGGVFTVDGAVIRAAALTGNVVLSPDGRTLAAHEVDGSLHLWNVETGKKIMSVGDDKKAAARRGVYGGTSLAFSADSKELAIRGLDQALRLVNVASQETRTLGDPKAGALLRTARFGGAGGNTLAFLQGGKTIASVIVEVVNQRATTVIRLSNVEDGKNIRDIKTAENNFVAGVLAVSPDEKLLAWGGQDGTVILYDPESGKEIRRLGQPRQGQFLANLVFSPNGKTLAGRSATNATVLLWDVESGKELPALGQAPGPMGRGLLSYGGFVASQTIAFSPDGETLVEATPFNTVRFWKVATRKEMDTTGPGHHGGVTKLAISPDGKVLTTFGADRVIRQWDAATGEERRRLSLPGDTSTVALAADGNLAASTSANNAIRLWDLATGKERRPMPMPRERQLGFGGNLALSRDGKLLAVRGVDQVMHLFDTATGKELRPLGDRTANDNRAYVYYGGQSPLVFSPAAEALATVTGSGAMNARGGVVGGQPVQGNAILLWNLGGKQPHRFEATKGAILALAFSPDGRTIIALEADKTVSLWEALTGKECFKIKLASDDPRKPLDGKYAVPAVTSAALALSPDGRTLAVGDQTIRLFDLPSGKELGKFSGHKGAVLSLAFAADSRTLISGSADTTALIWDGGRAIKQEKPKPIELTAQQLEDLWKDLAASPAKAYQAMIQLERGPKQVPAFFSERLQPAPGVDPKRIDQLVAELESDQFQVRKKASEELEKFGELAQPALQRALDAQPALETQRRLERLLDKIVNDQVPSTEVQQAIRAMQVLQSIGTAEVRPLLQRMAQGAPGHRLTRYAQAALKRVGG